MSDVMTEGVANDDPRAAVLRPNYQKAIFIDKLARVVFPCLFLLGGCFCCGFAVAFVASWLLCAVPLFICFLFSVCLVRGR